MARTIDEQVRLIIAEQLDVKEDDVQPETSFVDDLGADSLDIVQLLMAMEDAFDVEFPDEEAENIRTVQDAINYVQEHAG